MDRYTMCALTLQPLCRCKVPLDNKHCLSTCFFYKGLRAICNAFKALCFTFPEICCHAMCVGGGSCFRLACKARSKALALCSLLFDFKCFESPQLNSYHTQLVSHVDAEHPSVGSSSHCKSKQSRKPNKLTSIKNFSIGEVPNMQGPLVLLFICNFQLEQNKLLL